MDNVAVDEASGWKQRHRRDAGEGPRPVQVDNGEEEREEEEPRTTATTAAAVVKRKGVASLIFYWKLQGRKEQLSVFRLKTATPRATNTSPCAPKEAVAAAAAAPRSDLSALMSPPSFQSVSALI